MDSNQGVAYIGPGKVELQAIDFPCSRSGTVAATTGRY